MNRKAIRIHLTILLIGIICLPFAAGEVEKLDLLQAKLPGPVFIYTGDTDPNLFSCLYPDLEDEQSIPRLEERMFNMISPPGSLASAGGSSLGLHEGPGAERVKCLGRAFDEGGMAYSVAIHGNTCYVGTSGSLSIFDVTDPLEPVLMNRLAGLAAHMDIEGTLMAAATAPAGAFTLFDITDPIAPVELSKVEPPEGFYFWDLTMSGSLGVATGLGYDETFGYCAIMQVIDLSDPNNPELKSTMLGITDSYREVLLDGTTLYLTVQYEGLAIFDISDPTLIIQVGFETLYDYIDGMTLDGGLLYCSGHGIEIVDVSDPGHPERIGQQGGGYTADVALSGTTAYVTDDDDHTLRVIDVTDPTAPVKVGELPAYGKVYDMELSGDKIYLPDRVYGLLVVDISNPDVPALMSMTETGFYSFGIDVEDGIAAATTNFASLHTLDVSDPFDPVVLGYHVQSPDTTPNNTPFLMDVDLSGGIAVASDWYWGFLCYDVSAPALPDAVGSLKTSDGVNPVERMGDLVYTGYTELLVVDISDPAAPVQVGTGPALLGGITDIKISGNTCYVSSYDELLIADLTNPVVPMEMARYSMPEYVKGIAIEGDVLGLYREYTDWTFHSAAFELYDVSYPAQLTLLGSVDMSSPVRFHRPGGTTVRVQDGIYYLCSSEQLTVIDGRDPNHPVRSAVYPEIPLKNVAWLPHEGVCAANGLVYLGGQDGLEILRFLDVGLFLEPDVEPVSAPSGGSFTYTMKLKNFTSTAQTVSASIEELFPDGSSGLLSKPYWLRLGPGEEVIYTKEMKIPYRVQPGTYHLNAQLHNLSGEELDSDRITFEVIP